MSNKFLQFNTVIKFAGVHYATVHSRISVVLM